MSLQPCDRSSVPGNLKTSSLCGHAAVGVHRVAECQATVMCSVFASLGLYCDFLFPTVLTKQTSSNLSLISNAWQSSHKVHAEKTQQTTI